MLRSLVGCVWCGREQTQEQSPKGAISPQMIKLTPTAATIGQGLNWKFLEIILLE